MMPTLFKLESEIVFQLDELQLPLRPRQSPNFLTPHARRLRSGDFIRLELLHSPDSRICGADRLIPPPNLVASARQCEAFLENLNLTFLLLMLNTCQRIAYDIHNA